MHVVDQASSMHSAAWCGIFFIAQASVEHRRRLMTDFDEYRRRVEGDMAEASEAYRREFRSKASQGAVATGVN